ncbi:pentapeptide repeat-containing protein [Flavobacterium selenitireducens]|uniref:pentapeptide repeat-containing protein n=1 Tax=Flavobacterium selenitireducens TaxID=2722704 RepID=UPI00168AD924|nr:pentapeptide repeat-containing protein [Flavobacterium selenitireducens]MBD3581122.1 pentapeptide repeat-containing protein [Flavobacterium selenitireducens]
MIRYHSNQKFIQIFSKDEIMYSDFENCTFDACDFTSCDFTGVAFIDCRFNDCNFEAARINYVALRGAHFYGCDFTDVNFAMVDRLLFDVSFTDCTLDRTKFYTLKLQKTQFTNCSIIASDFMAADISDSVFHLCNLHKSLFSDTIAIRTDFLTSFNYTMDPQKNKLKKAIFSKDGVSGLLAHHEIIVK